MLNIRKFVVVMFPILNKRGPGYAEVCIFLKLCKQKLKIIRAESNIGIKVSYNIIIQIFGFCVSCIKTAHLCRKVTLPMLRHPNKLNPRILLEILLYNIIGPVC